MRGRRGRWVIVSAVQGVMFGSTALGAINASWVAPVSSSWTDPTAWSTNPVFPNMDQPDPGDFYNATIGASGSPYTVTLGPDNIIISQLTINSPSVTLQQLSGSLQLVDGGLSVTSGTYRLDGGALISDDPMSIASNFIWNGGAISGFGAVNLTPGAMMTVSNILPTLMTTLNNSGIINLAPSSAIALDEGTINNLAGGVMNFSATSRLLAINQQSDLFNNAGVINLAGGSSISINVPFQNSGTINLNGATLSLNSAGTVTWLKGSVVAGFGSLDMGFNTTQVLAGKLTLNAANAVMGGGTITGSGDLQINDAFNWNSGTMSGTGITRVAHGAAINFGSSSASRGLSRTLINDGVVNIGSGQFFVSNGTLNNMADGVVNISSSQPFILSGSNIQPILNNAGIFNINTLSTTTLSSMINSGTINALAGTTSFNGTFNWESGAYLGGSATIDLSNGTHIVNGTLTLAGSNIRLGSGTMFGPGNINITNTFNWNGGTIDGGGSFGGIAGNLNVLPGANLNIGSFGSSPRTLGRTLNNSGVINILSSGGTLAFSNGTLNNLAGGTLNIFSTNPFPNSTGTLSLIRNSGVINVDLGSVGGFGSVILGGTMPVQNSGTINLLSGSLALGSGTQSAGAYITGAGFIDLLGVSFGTQVLDGTTTLAGSNLNFNGGTVTGEGNLLIRGNFNWGSGTFSGNGIIDINSTSMMNVATFGTRSLGRTINNAGVINISQGSVQLNNGVINNLPGATMNLASTGSSSPIFQAFGGGSLSAINNLGQININAGAGTFNLFNSGSSSLFDSGTINANNGTVILGGGTFGTGANITGGAYVELAGASFGTITLTDTLNLNGSNINVSSGTLNGVGNLAVNNTFNWNGGTLAGTGAVNIAPTGVMNIVGVSGHQLARTINNAGTLNLSFSSGLLSIGSSSINNQPGGVVNINTPTTAFSGETPGFFNNDGLINLTTGVAFNGLQLIDSGTINVAAGTLAVGTTTLEAGAYFTGGGTVSFGVPFGTISVNGTATLASNNSKLVTSSLVGPGDLVIAKNFSFESGTLSGSGVVNVLPGATFNLGPVQSTRTLSRTINNSGTMLIPLSGASFNGGTINNLAGGVINAGTAGAIVNFTPSFGVANRVTNAGTFNVLGGTLTEDISFSNTGTLIVGGGSTSARAFFGSVSQLVGTTLLRGTWIVHNNAMLSLGAGTGTIANNAANVTLDGPSATFPNINAIANNTGTFAVTGGQSFVTSASYTNTGETVVGAGSTLHITGTLNSTGTLDVQGTLIVDGSSPASVLAAVESGRNGGAWNGSGISSTSAASNSQTALGFAQASALGITGSGTFDSQPINGTSVVVRYTLLGDANLDNTVNALDFNSLASHFGESGAVWSDSDFNYDGTIDTADFTALAANFGATLSSPAVSAPEVLGAIVPEPGAGMILLASSLTLIRRRRLV